MRRRGTLKANSIRLRFKLIYVSSEPRVKCAAGQFECDGVCRDSAIKCDGRYDCSDGSDESECVSFRTTMIFNLFVIQRCSGCWFWRNLQINCDSSQYACRDGSDCIPFSYVCDRKEDCADGSDEESCPG